MKVLIDGEEIEFLNDVKIIWDETHDNWGQKDESHLTATSEGIIVDMVQKDGTVAETQSVEVSDLFNILLIDNA